MGGNYTIMCGHNAFVICTVGEAMQQIVAKGIGHMEWNMGLQAFVKANPQDPPVTEVQVKVLSQMKKQFMWRRASLWSKLGNTKPKKEVALADMGAMVCTTGLNMFGDLRLQKDVMTKTKMVVRDQCLHWWGH